MWKKASESKQSHLETDQSEKRHTAFNEAAARRKNKHASNLFDFFFIFFPFDK